MISYHLTSSHKELEALWETYRVQNERVVMARLRLNYMCHEGNMQHASYLYVHTYHIFSFFSTCKHST